jgi:hypothetical protein
MNGHTTAEELWIRLEALRGLLFAEYDFDLHEIAEVEHAALVEFKPTSKKEPARDRIGELPVAAGEIAVWPG